MVTKLVTELFCDNVIVGKENNCCCLDYLSMYPLLIFVLFTIKCPTMQSITTVVFQILFKRDTPIAEDDWLIKMPQSFCFRRLKLNPNIILYSQYVIFFFFFSNWLVFCESKNEVKQNQKKINNNPSNVLIYHTVACSKKCLIPSLNSLYCSCILMASKMSLPWTYPRRVLTLPRLKVCTAG